MTNKMVLDGIDIASHQTGINLAKVPCDFVIIKATQGVKYVNPDLTRTYNDAVKAGKLIGFYHYASSGGAEAEAEHFLNTIGKSRIGKGILVLDWEAGDNKNWCNVSYAKRFLDYIRSKTGITPFIYMSKTVCRDYNWSSVARDYPLWAAQYPNYVPTGYKDVPWTDKGGYGAWANATIFQYTSVGRLPNWSGNLDLDKAYMTATEWQIWASYKGAKTPISDKPKAGNTGRINVSTYPTIKLRHKNEYVRLLQNALSVRGYSVGLFGSDGVFGTDTLYAVKLFQKDFGLTVDGIVGQQTWNALFNK